MNWSKYKVKRADRDIETHEVFLDKLAQKNEEETGVSGKKFEVKIAEKTIYALFGVFALIVIVFFAKTFYLQVFRGAELRQIAQNNKGKINIVAPERGIIYDRNMKKLVSNTPTYDLVCDKRRFYEEQEDYLEEIKKLAQILNDDYGQIANRIADSDESKVLIAEKISHENLLVIETKSQELPDCRAEKNTARNYVFGESFSHVLGYLGRISKEDLRAQTGSVSSNYSANDYMGKSGLEKSYEEVLRGVSGRTETEKRADGAQKENKILSLPQSGGSLVLNIDSDLQKKVYESLEKSIKNIGAKKGAAVALNPKTGAVLAVVSYPSFDNNIFSAGVSRLDFEKLQNSPYQPFFNRAISSQYPTGSTIKPFLAAGALQENIISPLKQINDPGYILVRSQYDPEVVYKFGGVEPHGLVDMKKAIAVSSNIYFYTIGGGYDDQQGLGPSRIKKYLDLFGWEQKTGIDLPGEFKGFVPTPEWKKGTKKEPWWDGDTYNLSIGQSDLQVTPLQVAVAYAAIANGGTLYKPQIVQKIINSAASSPVVQTTGLPEVVKEFHPEIAGRVGIDEENLKIIREGMRDGVLYGSSVMLKDLPVAVAGKTGTAETNRDGVFNTWSSNFAPYDDPEIVFVATIEGVEGLRAATLPVAKEILQYYFSKK